MLLVGGWARRALVRDARRSRVATVDRRGAARARAVRTRHRARSRRAARGVNRAGRRAVDRRRTLDVRPTAGRRANVRRRTMPLVVRVAPARRVVHAHVAVVRTRRGPHVQRHVAVVVVGPPVDVEPRVAVRPVAAVPVVDVPEVARPLRVVRVMAAIGVDDAVVPVDGEAVLAPTQQVDIDLLVIEVRVDVRLGLDDDLHVRVTGLDRYGGLVAGRRGVEQNDLLGGSGADQEQREKEQGDESRPSVVHGTSSQAWTDACISNLPENSQKVKKNA